MDAMLIEATLPSDPAPRLQPLRSPARPRPAAGAEPARPAGSARDRVDVSGGGRELAEAAAAVDAADGERTELILRIRQQIAEGSYEADAEAVARVLLHRLEGGSEA